MGNSDNPLEGRRKAQEEDYFRKQNDEAKRKLAAKQALQEFGINDQDLMKKLLEAGFSADSARALFLVPLIEVAWADGQVQEDERRAVLELMKQREIEEGSEAYRCASDWLETKPTDQKFRVASELLKPVVDELKKSGQDTSEWILEAAQKVANATGGLFGFGWNMISKEEKEILVKLSKQLK